MTGWTPREGDDVVDLFVNGRPGIPDRCGPVVQVRAVTTNLVITTENERYSREHLTPVSEGRYSSRHLVRANDDRVLCVRGRRELESIAQLARNLADLPRRNPTEIAAALARLTAASSAAYKEFGQLMAAATAEKKEVS